ncbi:Tim10/DDP family zinc finger-domain-containing protein [Blastocladiella britannica]|nr:Tim10/DDP family zinc finger-domain-containing protein [Blastocladiella britannica]
MSFFGGSSATPSTMPSNEERVAQIKQQLRQELALSNLQELVNKVGENCYAKCITTPGAKLSSGEETCLAKCMDRYMDAFNVVAKSYELRVREEMTKGN